MIPESQLPPGAAMVQRSGATMMTIQAETPSTPADAVDIGELARVLRRHKRLVLKIAVTIFVVATAWVLLTRMRFTATARIYLGELEAPRATGGQRDETIDLSPEVSGDVGTEVELLRSRSLIGRAVLASGVNATIKLPSWSPPRYYRWLLSFRSSELLDVASRELIAIDASLADRSATRGYFRIDFTSDVDFEIRDQTQGEMLGWSIIGLENDGPSGRLVARGRLGELVHGETLAVRLMSGHERGPKANSHYKLVVDSVDDFVDNATKRTLDITVPTSKGPVATGQIMKVADLSFTDSSPEKAAAFLNHLIRGYMEERHAWKTENATAAETFLTSELTKTREKLDELQAKMAEFRTNNGGVVVDDEARSLTTELATFEEQVVAARIAVDALSALNYQLKSPHPKLESFMMGEAKDDTVLQSMAGALSLSQQTLAELEARYNFAAPEVQHQRKEMDSQLEAIRNYVATRLYRARGTLQTLEHEVARYEDKLRSIPGAQVELSQLARESEVYSELYSQLLKMQQETGLTRAAAISKNRVVDAPIPPYTELFLKPVIGLVSCPVGVMIGILFVIVRSLVSGRLQHATDIRRSCGDLPVFATIPVFFRKRDEKSVECIESFRTLRACVYNASTRNRGTTVLFTSPSSRDGKSTCARLLASSLALGGRSVLLVDTAMVRPPRSRRKRTDKVRMGLSDVLLNNASLAAVAATVQVSEECTFQKIEGGQAGASDLLASSAMATFVASIRDKYDFILVEAPGYPAVSDTLGLLPLADLTLTIIRLGHTSRMLAVEHLRQLAVRTRFGVVLNGAS